MGLAWHLPHTAAAWGALLLPGLLGTWQGLLLIVLLGVVIGLMSGLLGIGGGLLMMPAIVLIPPLLFGQPLVGIQLASGVAALQGLASSSSGTWVHWKKKTLNLPYVLALGIPSVVGGVLGAIVSKFWSREWMLLVLGAVLCFTLFQTCKTFIRLYLRPAAEATPAPSEQTEVRYPWASLKRSQQLGLMFASLLIGMLAGVIGLGGAMFYIPILSDFLGLPYKAALATSAGVVWLTSIGSSVGKVSQGVVPWVLTAWVAGLTLVFGWLGAKLQYKLPTRWLRVLHISLISLALFETLRQVILSL